jgi:hypothetical protein
MQGLYLDRQSMQTLRYKSLARIIHKPVLCYAGYAGK